MKDPSRSYLSVYVPALIWTALLILFSSNTFSSGETGGLLDTLIHALKLKLGTEDIELIHHLMRKCGHFSAYSLLAFLWHRVFDLRASRWAYLWALLICWGMASWDEYNQSLLSDRTGSVADVAIDVLGSHIIVLWRLWSQKKLPKFISSRAKQAA